MSSEEGGYTLNAKPLFSLIDGLNSLPEGPWTIVMALTAGTSLFGAWDFYIAMTAALEVKSRKKAGFLSATILTGTTWIVKKIHLTSYSGL